MSEPDEMSDEPKYDDDELAQATALADALAQRTKPPHVADAVEAAEVVALLKAPTLGEAQAGAVLASVEHALERERRAKRAHWLLASGAGALAIAAAALLMVQSTEPSMAPVPSAASRVEAPQPAGGAPNPNPAASALRDSQIAWLQAPSPKAQVALDQALGAYRAAQLDELERRYAR